MKVNHVAKDDDEDDDEDDESSEEDSSEEESSEEETQKPKPVKRFGLYIATDKCYNYNMKLNTVRVLILAQPNFSGNM